MHQFDEQQVDMYDAKFVRATETVASDSQNLYDGIVRTSSYENIYVGTKLPGDEPLADDSLIDDVTDIGADRPPTTSGHVDLHLARRTDVRSSSYENLYEKAAGPDEDDEDGGGHLGEPPRTVRHGRQSTGDEHRRISGTMSLQFAGVEPATSSSSVAVSSSPIDITFESGLDRIGQDYDDDGGGGGNRCGYVDDDDDDQPSGTGSGGCLQHSASCELESPGDYRRLTQNTATTTATASTTLGGGQRRFSAGSSPDDLGGGAADFQSQQQLYRKTSPSSATNKRKGISLGGQEVLRASSSSFFHAFESLYRLHL